MRTGTYATACPYCNAFFYATTPLKARYDVDMHVLDFHPYKSLKYANTLLATPYFYEYLRKYVEYTRQQKDEMR